MLLSRPFRFFEVINIVRERRCRGAFHVPGFFIVVHAAVFGSICPDSAEVPQDEHLSAEHPVLRSVKYQAPGLHRLSYHVRGVYVLRRLCRDDGEKT